MKALVGLMVIGSVLLSGCQLGLSEEEVESIVAQEIAKSEELLTLKLRDERNRKLTDLTDKIEKARDETEVMKTELTESYELTMKAMSVHVGESVRAICSVNHTATVLYSTLYWLLDFIVGGEATMDHVVSVFGGIALDDQYAEIAVVCDVDDEGSWYLLPLPYNAVAPAR